MSSYPYTSCPPSCSLGRQLTLRQLHLTRWLPARMIPPEITCSPDKSNTCAAMLGSMHDQWNMAWSVSSVCNRLPPLKLQCKFCWVWNWIPPCSKYDDHGCEAANRPLLLDCAVRWRQHHESQPRGGLICKYSPNANPWANQEWWDSLKHLDIFVKGWLYYLIVKGQGIHSCCANAVWCLYAA